MRIGLLDGQQGGTGLGEGHHGLDDEQIHPGLLQCLCLLGVDLHQFLKGGIPQRVQEFARGSDVTGHKGLLAHGGTGDAHQLFVVCGHLIENAVALQLHPVGAEGGSIDHPASGGEVGVLNVVDGFGVLQHPLLGADGAVKALLLQLSAGGAVQNQGIFYFHGDSSLSKVICSGKRTLKRPFPESSR